MIPQSPTAYNEEEEPQFTKEDVDLQFLLEYGLTPYAWDTLRAAAQVMVDTGDRDEALRVFFNQINNFCNDARINTRGVFQEFINELDERMESF
jgi:hypothetical protein